MDNPEAIPQPNFASATPPTSPDNPSPPSTLPFSPLILQVGSERFFTTIETLSRSPLFKVKLQDGWRFKKQVDGSYFLDADPEIFAHILRFLRHGIYPLAYDSVKGHDFGMYAAISRLADVYHVKKLSVWLKEQRYLEVIRTETSTRIAQEEVNKEEGLVPSNIGNRTSNANVKFQYFPSFNILEKYVCPRGVKEHYDNPEGCGEACKQVQGDKEDEYEDTGVMSTVIVKEKKVFNRKLCLEE
ncbi:MAG: hypothetical protein Q9212_006700 [Teloschistes hypoglaucus]